MSLTQHQLERFLHSLAAQLDERGGAVEHRSGTRSYTQLLDSPEINAWLIAWEHGGDTGWHDHDDSAAAIAVLEGQLREERLRLGGEPASRVVAASRTFYVPPWAIHRVTHAGPHSALSLHVYSPPLRRTGAYSMGPGGELQRTAQSYEEELRPQAAAI